MNRYNAAATHLGISAAVIAIFFSIVFFIWYPAPYFSIEGTYDVIIILIAVDLVLGPLLTLVIFKTGKPGLKFDLSMIALVQISALLYGGNTIYSERPYFIAFAVNQFSVIQANVATKEMDLSLIDPKINYKHLGPSYVYAENPPDSELAMRISLEAAAGGPDIDRHPELYRDFKKYISRSFNQSLDLDTLAKQYPGNDVIVKEFRRHYPDTKSLAFFPLFGKQRHIILVVDRNSAEVIDYLEINPLKRKKLSHIEKARDLNNNANP